MAADNDSVPVLSAGNIVSIADTEQVTLCDVLDRVLNKGTVVVGHATISVAGVDLLYLGLQVVLTSVEKAEAVMVRRPSQLET